jgi:hypothetical protein
MSIQEYTKKPEDMKYKYIVLDKIYSDLGKVLNKPVVSSILTGPNYHAPLNRVWKFIAKSTTSTVKCWEKNDKTWTELKRKMKISNEKNDKQFQVLFGNDTKRIPVIFYNDDIFNSPAAGFEDFDVCGKFESFIYPSKTSMLDSFIERLKKQSNFSWYHSVPCSFIGTVALRAGGGKEFTFDALNLLLNVFDYELFEIDMKRGSYDKGFPIESNCSWSKYANQHDVYYVKRRKYLDDIDFKLYTYSDTTHMLTFVISHGLRFNNKRC